MPAGGFHIMAQAPADASTPTSAAPATLAPVDPEHARALVFPLYADRATEAGEPLTDHAEAIVQIVSTVRPDRDLLAAAYLFAAHEVVRDADRWLRTHFGPSVAQLVSDLRQLRHLSEAVRTRMRAHARADGALPEGQDEALRRMLLAMVNDMRVVLLRLASRLQTLRFLAAQRRDGSDYARETRTLYAPLANRLGIWQFKWELEDLSLRFLEPQDYQRVARLLEEKRGQRELRVSQAVATLETLLRGAGIGAQVNGRPKHIASIAAKMRAKDVGFERIFDQRALRVVVERVEHCYEVLALVHQRWRPVAGEYDDYIAKPKANGYQSLHTVVEDDDGKPLEIQIRTRAMHEQAELGVAAHWRYKEGGDGPAGARAETEKVAWLRRLLDWQREVEPAGAAHARRSGLRDDPAGPGGGAGAGGDGGRFCLPHPHRARSPLPRRAGRRRLGGAQHPAAHRPDGRDHQRAQRRAQPRLAQPGTRILGQPALRGQGAPMVPRPGARAVGGRRSRAHRARAAAARTHRGGPGAIWRGAWVLPLTEELCAAAVTDEFSLRIIEQTLQGGGAGRGRADRAPERGASTAPGRGSVLVVGVDSLLTSLARCCRPIPPDPIIGFVTRGRGISVHRANCANARTLMARQPERLIEVAWERTRPSAAASLPVEIVVLAGDRQGLLRDIGEVFAREKLNVIGVNTVSQRDQAQMQFTIEVPDLAVLRRALPSWRNSRA